jgi:hypothetical protein
MNMSVEGVSSKSYYRPDGEIAIYYLFCGAMFFLSLLKFAKASRGNVVMAIVMLAVSVAGLIFTSRNVARPAVTIASGNISYYPPNSNEMAIIPLGTLVSFESRTRDVLTFTTIRGDLISISIGRLGKADKNAVLDEILGSLPISNKGI